MHRKAAQVNLREVYNLLYQRYGEQGWWPTVNPQTGQSEYHKGNYKIPETDEQKFQIVLGALLTQNTTWKNVEKALSLLYKKTGLDPQRICALSKEELATLLHSTGYHNQKAERVQHVLSFLLVHATLFSKPTEEVRAILLSLKGIGPETADSILLYAAKKPCFVIDAYTKRIFSRVGLCEKTISYDALQKQCTEALPQDVNRYNNYHALLVQLAKDHCKATPICEACPLRHVCKNNADTIPVL